MNLLISLIVSILIAAACTGYSRKLLHVFQLESYQLPGYKRSFLRSRGKLILLGGIPGVAGFLLAAAGLPVLLCALLELAAAAASWVYVDRQKQKKPFVLTERVKRLMAVHMVVALILSLLLCAFSCRLALLLPLFETRILAIASLAAKPMEKKINDQFAKDAQQRLDSVPGIIRIGITGSYGKTSTKFLLKEILSVKWNVLATPGSFNTTMGVTRVIREMLTPAHQVFIAEMGARHPGDIRELVELVHPTIGILTSIGPQHLDTFGSIEGVAAAKKELIDGLPDNGIAVLANDGAWCTRVYENCSLKEKYLAGSLLEAKNIEIGPWGTRFTLLDTQTGEEATCSTKLLGRHSIDNMMLCCITAKKLGMTLPEIAIGIARCKPVEHRLQLLDAGQGITIIDDAFNSNPAGAKAAVEVLSAFPGRRIIVTPGMVELGEKEAEYNREFGRQIASGADIAILVGARHTKPIAEGLKEVGFDDQAVYVAETLDEARKLMEGLLRPGDVVMYENDLPDNY